MRMILIAAAASLAISGGAALAQNGPSNQQHQQRQAATAPQPNRSQEKSGTALFPNNEPVPQYSTSANNASESLQVPGGSREPNAGNTGLHGSGGSGFGTNTPGAGMTR